VAAVGVQMVPMKGQRVKQARNRNETEKDRPINSSAAPDREQYKISRHGNRVNIKNKAAEARILGKTALVESKEPASPQPEFEIEREGVEVRVIDAPDYLFGESKKPVYTRKRPPSEAAGARRFRMGDAATLQKINSLAADLDVPEAERPAFSQWVLSFPASGRETTQHRPKWKPDLGLTAAQFAAQAYAPEIANGTFDKSLVKREDITLYNRLFREKAWGALAELTQAKVPTKSERNTQRLIELAERGEQPSRSDDIGLYEARRYRSKQEGQNLKR
jgi:hypothetical protein